MIEYTALSLADASSALHDIARDAESAFGHLDVQQLNWKPEADRWSVAQCFEHLVTGNRLMLRAAHDALDGAQRTIWQRVPLMPRVLGSLMIRSQSPGVSRRYVAPSAAQPIASEISADIIERFIAQQDEAATWMQTLDEGTARHTIMVSPFVRFIAYSVLDGCRLMAAHDRRHFEQARRVTVAYQFPSPASRQG